MKLWKIRKNIKNFITITYQKDGKKKTPRIVAYVDGPFITDKENMSLAEKKKILRDMVYEKMLERSKNSNVEVIKYIKTEDKQWLILCFVEIKKFLTDL